MTQQVLALKWRPRTFNEVIGQPHVVQALSNGLDNNRLHHAFLFTGTRGVGKTTLARIFAKSLNCEKGVSSNPCGECSICKEVDEGRFVDLIEIDAASRTRVEDTREILDNVQYAPTRGRYKIYLIDEVHMLSNSSFNALLKTLEEPPSHVKFLLATTDPQKLPVTVLSRCLRFQLKRIQDQEICGQLEKILTNEAIDFDIEALKLIAKAGDGSMRDALSLLDQAIAYGGQSVQYQSTHEMLGLIDTQYLAKVLEALATKESAPLLAALEMLKANGLDYYRFLEDLIDAFHLLTLIQLAPELGEAESDEMRAMALQFSAEDLQLFYQVALNGRKDLQNHPNSEVGFEMTLLRMILFAPTAPVGIAPASGQKKSQLIPNSSLVSVAPADVIVKADNSDELPVAVEVFDKADVTGTMPASVAEEIDLPWDDEVLEDGTTNIPQHDNGTASVNADGAEIIVPNTEIIEDTDKIPASLEMPEISPHIDESEDSNDHASMDHDYIVEAGNREAPTFDIQEMVGENDVTGDIGHQVDQIPKAGQVITSTADLLNNNEQWLSLVSSLSLESVLSGIAHSLVFKDFDGINLILERPLSVKDFRIDEAEMRLAMAISMKLGVTVACRIEYVEETHDENLHERTERLDDERYQKALDAFEQDEVVKYLRSEYHATLLDRTLKPLDDE